MSVSAVVIISVMLKPTPRAQTEQLSTAVCKSNHKVFPLVKAAVRKEQLRKILNEPTTNVQSACSVWTRRKFLTDQRQRLMDSKTSPTLGFYQNTKEPSSCFQHFYEKLLFKNAEMCGIVIKQFSNKTQYYVILLSIIYRYNHLLHFFYWYRYW